MRDNNTLKNNELNIEELEMVTGGGLPSWLTSIVMKVVPVIYHYEPQDSGPTLQETIILPDTNVTIMTQSSVQ